MLVIVLLLLGALAAGAVYIAETTEFHLELRGDALITQEYGDKVAVIAVHSYDEYGQNVPAYIQKTFPDSPFIFVRDGEGNAYCNMLGGGQSWPHTLILDENGVIRTIIPRSTTYEELKEALEAIVAD